MTCAKCMLALLGIIQSVRGKIRVADLRLAMKAAKSAGPCTTHARRKKGKRS